MKMPFDRAFQVAHVSAGDRRAPRKSGSRKARQQRIEASLRHESLEQRAMMAIYTAGGGPLTDFMVIASDDASDVYVQQRAGLVSHSGETLLIADNSSFLNLREVKVPDILYVTNGSPGSGPGAMQPGDNSTAPGPGYQNDMRLRDTTFFSLPEGNIVLPSFRSIVLIGGGVARLLPRDPPPAANPIPFDSELFLLDRATPEIRGVIEYSGDRWEFEVIPETSRIAFRPARYDVQLNATLTQNQNVISVPNTTNVETGMRVFGQNIPSGTTVTAVGTTTITLSQAATQTTEPGTQDLLGFVNLNADSEPLSGSIDQGRVLDSTNLGNGQRGYLTVQWRGPRVPTVATTLANPAPPKIERINYGVDDDSVPDFAVFAGGGQNIFASPVDLNQSRSVSTTQFKFDLPAGTAPKSDIYGVIPGTFRGRLKIDDRLIDFRTDITAGNTLYFNLIDPETGNAFSYGDADWVRVEGSFSETLGANPSITVSLRFTNAFATDFDGRNKGTLAVLPGTVELTSVSWLAYVRDPNPNSFTVSAGHDLTSQLEVELLTPASTIDINSRVLVTSTLNDDDSVREDVVLQASTINIDSEVVSRDVFRVQATTFGSTFAVAETLRVNAAVAAPTEFIIDIADDPATTPNPGSVFDGPLKGLISLSASGSFSGSPSPTPGLVATPSRLITIRGEQADLYVAGTIYGTKQTYLLNSDDKGQGLAPYVFATRSELTEVDTGLIRGDNVAITLGNDAPTPLDGSIAFNTLDLSTQVESLRVKAATRQQTVPTVPLPTPSPSGPFPYNLSIREKDDISIDAVAASGLPLSISSGGNMRFTSALATAGDVTLQALKTSDTPSRLTVSAPLSTTKGKIRLIGDGVAVNNSVLVTAADDDEFRDDIWITSNAGDMSVSGLVSAVNRIKIEQQNPLGPTTTPYQNTTPLPLPDLSTRIQSVRVDDDFTFDNLDVGIDMTHTFVGDLRLTLIAPDGRRFRLSDRNGGGGDNFTGTIFDTEAPTPISQGAAPFTGRFRPVDSLSPLYRSSALGTWQLEIVDAAGGDSGTLTNFSLLFQTLEPQAAKVFGPARLVAAELLLDVQGSVGNPALLPADTNFFIRTDVDTLSGRVGGNTALSERNDINITSLRSGGFVSLRADGVDPVTGANAGSEALRANLIDITGLDVATPNGSLDVFFDTSKTIELGNAQGLRTGRSLNSLAAGDVTIRSNAGSIVALDAPVAGGNARGVRVATAALLSATQNDETMSLVTYNPGNPGVTPSTLRGRGDLNKWFGVQIQPLRAGDRVLVKDQAQKSQNGVYAVSFISTPAWSQTTTWTLTRATDSDTAAELPGNSFVSVGERQANNVNQTGVYQITANYIQLNGATLAGATYATASTTVTLPSTADLTRDMAVFGPGIAAGTTITSISGSTSITLSQNPSAASGVSGETLKFVSPAVILEGTKNSGLDDILITGLVTTSDLRVGMLVVGTGIPDDTVITRILDRTTVVLSQSATDTGFGRISFITPFVTRVGNTSGSTVEGLSRTGDLIEGMVVVGHGVAPDTTITKIDNGTTITLSRAVTTPQSGVSLKFLAASPTNFGRAPITVAREDVTTNIGSNNPNSKVTFVVSTTGGTNNSAGSLGKMISLRQQNSARLAGDDAEAPGSQPMDFRFSAAVATNLTPIRLTQELPEITKAFILGGSPTYPAAGVPGSATQPLIDGSRITHARNGRNIVSGDTVSGLVVRGPDAAGTVIRNVNLGGFSREVKAGQTVTARSAAIDVIDAAGVLVSNVTLGVSELNVRLGNSVGVRFSGGGTTSGTLLDSKVFGSNDSGLAVENNATGITVVGSTFGKAGVENAIGATLTTGANQFGVDAVSPILPIPPVAMTREAANRFSLPANWPSAARLVPGMQILGATVVPSSGNARATISSVSTNAITGVTTVTVTGGTVTQSGNVIFLSNDPVSFSDVVATRVNATTFTLSSASRATGAMLYAGLTLMGATIQPASSTPQKPVEIAAVSVNPVTGVTTVTITGGEITGNGSVRFGHIVYTELNGLMVSLPSSVNMANLFLGQAVTGIGIAGGTTIAAIDRVNRTVTFAAGRGMTRTGFSAITFTAGGRNTVTQNRTGLVLAGGATTVTNTSIVSNTFNGIEIRNSGWPSTAPTAHHRIGTSLAPTARSNQIHSNGRWGVFFASSMTDDQKNLVTIQGNFLGTTSLAVVPSTLSNVKGNIGHVAGREVVFAGLSSRLVARVTDGLDAVNNQHGRYQAAGGGGGGGTGGTRPQS